MNERSKADTGNEDDLAETLHAMRNCLSAIRSDCILIEDALARNEADEIQPIVMEMRAAVLRASNLTHIIPKSLPPPPTE